MMATVSVLAEPPKNTGPDFGKASPVGLLVIVLLLIGVFIPGVVDEPAPQEAAEDVRHRRRTRGDRADR